MRASATTQTYIVDSFTDQPFKGNPAGVCVVEEQLSAERMQLIAQEINLSETAFVRRVQPGMQRWSIRFFSPKQEIPLCGHATLAAAKVLCRQQEVSRVELINVDGLSLVVVVTAKHGPLEMEFPVYRTQPAEAPPALLDALGLRDITNAEYNAETRILLLEIDSTGALAGLQPDFTALLNSHTGINGVLVTAKSDDGRFDFHSRYFWPWSGTHEDPVTGGTHTFLAPYWADRLHKTSMRSFQSSWRTGSMQVELRDAKLFIRGHAVIVFAGQLVI